MHKIIRDWILPQYKKYKQNRNTTDPEAIEQSIRTLLRKSRYVFLTTHSPGSNAGNGYCSSRYVQPIVEWQEHSFRIWIGTSAHSRKIAEIMCNPKVTVAVGHEGDGANLIVYGEATVHTDQAKKQKYWKSVWHLFFPEGATSDDEVVVCVKPVKLELMDFKRNIIPEPFGLVPLTLQEKDQRWAAV